MDIIKKDLGGNAEAEVVLYQPDSRLLATTLLSISAIFLTRVNWMKIQYVRNPYELLQMVKNTAQNSTILM